MKRGLAMPDKERRALRLLRWLHRRVRPESGSRARRSFRVLIINRWFGHKIGGVETQIRQIIGCLLESGYDVALVTSGKSCLTELPRQVTVYDVATKEGYYSFLALGVLYAGWYVVKATLLAARLARRGGFDAVLAFFSLDSFAARFIRLLCGLPYSLLVQENTILEVMEARRCDVAAFTNSAMVRLAGAENLGASIIPFSVGAGWNPISPEAYSGRLDRCDTLRLLTVGRLDARKDQLLLLRAVAVLNRHGIPAHLDVCGEGEMRSALEHEISALGATDLISLHGTVTGSRLADFYRRAHIFVMSSLFEGFGAVYLEAMASGLPVVATAGGATESTVADGGVILRERTPAAFAKALEATWRDKQLLLSLRARALARASQFGAPEQQRCVQQWILRVASARTGSLARRSATFLGGLADLPLMMRLLLGGCIVNFSRAQLLHERGRVRRADGE